MSQYSTYSEHNVVVMLGKVVIAVKESLWYEVSWVGKHLWVVSDEVKVWEDISPSRNAVLFV